MKSFSKIVSEIYKYLWGSNEYSYLPDGGSFNYPIDLDFTLNDPSLYYHPKDGKGIPCKEYVSVGVQYNPTRVAAYALANYNRFIETGLIKNKDDFLICANWFLGIANARYEYHFDWGELKAPWISCMAQGEAVSVLLRAYRITDEKIYLEHARRSLAPFFLLIKDGGVQSHLPDGSIFIEEYPSNSSAHVLNGFMYALIGLGEFNGFSDDAETQFLYDQLLSSLEKNIDLWSSGSWSLYDAVGSFGVKNFCTPSYHNLQISQLKWLADQGADTSIKKKIKLWEKGRKSFIVRVMALAGKITYRLIDPAQR